MLRSLTETLKFRCRYFILLLSDSLSVLVKFFNVHVVFRNDNCLQWIQLQFNFGKPSFLNHIATLAYYHLQDLRYNIFIAVALLSNQPVICGG